MLEYKKDFFLQSIPNPLAKISGTTYASSAVNITRVNLNSLKLRLNWTYCNCGSSSSIITAKKDILAISYNVNDSHCFGSI